MIRIVSSKRLAELERIERLHEATVIEINVGVGRWCAHNAIVSAVCARIASALDGTLAEPIDVFRDRLGLKPTAYPHGPR
jgi:hypothetical protein